ncbi:putative metal dependent phosphohydrolase [Nostocoides japonicum T1-X7]|uniref:Putative metal dependent phosphohydrolase n=1 Tax=Nostocoides japonicum T1-X7 TaxID=1194083 RepID=A0A077M0F2_9MICO|nr:putative metal dependent phosphohydrolase [Tetrasphaera japonica T1-X7]
MLAAVSQAAPRNKIAGNISLNIHSVIVLASVAMVGPVGAAVVGGFAYVSRLRSLPRVAMIFNIGSLGACGAISGVAYIGAGGLDPAETSGSADILLHVGVPLMAADVVHLVLNVCFLAAIQSLSRGAPFRAQVTMMLSSVGAAYVSYGVIALLLVLLWLPAGVGALSIVLVIGPLVAAQWGLGQYGAELTAHNRTLGALVAAIETKSPASIGQSALVAELSEWVAEELALPTRDVEAARTAGMLHDVGLLAVPVPLLDPGRVLTPEEERLVHGHLAEAAGMLRGISFLDRALVGIVHHGERVDGTGYPSKLAGDQIPPIARIVAVAGAYASLLTPRTDRHALEPAAAMAVLRDLAGSAFDPAVVAALGRAIARHAADPVVIPVTRLARTGSAVALDDPPVRGSGDGANGRRHHGFPSGRGMGAAVSP